MILSASRRTDIPCFYAPWLINRLEAGYALVRNPMNPARLSRIPLTPDVLDGIVLWTKNPAPMLPLLDRLDQLCPAYYFQFTLTPYDRELEPNLPPKEELVRVFTQLSQRLGRHRVVWRCDPIVLTPRLTVDWHCRQFRRLCQQLAPHTDTVVISFVDQYAKVKSPLIRPVPAETMAQLAHFIGQTAREFGLTAAACCEAGDFSAQGIGRSACIDSARLEAILGQPLHLRPDRNQRPGCGCAESVDIGAYNTCENGCIYCYASYSPQSAARNRASHDPAGELLIGSPRPGEQITLRPVRSARKFNPS